MNRDTPLRARYRRHESGYAGWRHLPTKGLAQLRGAQRRIGRRYAIAPPDPDTQILPVQGSREVLPAFAQAVVDSAHYRHLPQPFYQIYEGRHWWPATPWYLNADAERGHATTGVNSKTFCTHAAALRLFAGNPAHAQLDDWRRLFELSDRYGFVIAADECYSEIHFDDAQPPMGALQAAAELGRHDFRRLVSFSSLSKRSSLPGLRSGYVAGDAGILERFLLYRTYHGSAMSRVVAEASIAAWNDEHHVRENRRLYREKFDAVLPVLAPVLNVQRPQGGFLWSPTPLTTPTRSSCATGARPCPAAFARETWHEPGRNRIRIALVVCWKTVSSAARRIAEFCTSIRNTHEH